jgi:hypothetical protein
MRDAIAQEIMYGCIKCGKTDNILDLNDAGLIIREGKIYSDPYRCDGFYRRKCKNCLSSQTYIIKVRVACFGCAYDEWHDNK